MNSRTPLLLTVLVVVACTPAVTVTPIRTGPSYAATPDSVPIALFAETRPECKFEELASITVEGQRNWVNDEKVTEELKRRARAIGAHAIIGYSQASRNVSPGGGRMAGDYRVRSGTAIRYTDPGCQK